MAPLPAPNEDLAQLVGLLGMENVRTLIRTFLREYPKLLAQLETGDRKTRHRMAHSLKSNARVIGARDLSDRMAKIEHQLAEEGSDDLPAEEIRSITTAFNQAADTLRSFAEA